MVWGRSCYPAAGPASVASNDALVSLSEQAFNNVGKYLQAELSSTRRTNGTNIASCPC